MLIDIKTPLVALTHTVQTHENSPWAVAQRFDSKAWFNLVTFQPLSSTRDCPVLSCLISRTVQPTYAQYSPCLMAQQ